jgi:uncharacterized repeat protein (TIGR01451 family)
MVKTASRPTVTAAGQVVTYSFHVINTGNQTLTNVAINETQFSGTGTAPVVTCPATTLAPQDTTDCSGTYTVTQADIDAGSISNTATVSGTPPTGLVITSAPSSATVTAIALPGLALNKSAQPTTVDSVGDVVAYTFTVTNTGNVTLSGVGIDEQLFSGTGTLSAIDCPSGALAPSDIVNCTASYAVTQADLDAGSVSNTATASGTPPTGTAVSSTSSTATITVSTKPALTLVKTADATTITRAGQKITYRFLMTNTGNLTLADVTVNEGEFSGSGHLSEVSCPATTLAPGAHEACTATYTVTTEDLTADTLSNTAAASASYGSGDGSATVRYGLSTARVTIIPPATTPPPSGGSNSGGSNRRGSNSGGANGGSGGGTANTGADVLALVGIAAALLLTGGIVLAATPRGRRA